MTSDLFVFHSDTPDKTAALAKALGAAIQGGTVLALNGDLGAGKTLFIRGLAGGLGVPSECPVTSPTYTLINEYPGRLPLYHADLYRLEKNADFEEIGLYDIMDGEVVVAVEWPDRLHASVLPSLSMDCIELDLEIAGDTERRIRMIPHGRGAENLIHEIKKFSKEL